MFRHCFLILTLKKVELTRFFGRSWAWEWCVELIPPFVLNWGAIAQGRMLPLRMIPALDKLEDRQTRLGLTAEALPVERFTFEGGKKALAERMVEAVSGRAHRGAYASLHR